MIGGRMSPPRVRTPLERRLQAASRLAIYGSLMLVAAAAWGMVVTLDRPAVGGVMRNSVPPLTLVRPGDTIIVTERWF